MDLISLYYFQELSKDLNMTRTAQRLYISQQTLSNHIHRLEQHYGCPLLYRKPTLSLTCAGEFVLSFAQVVRKEERNLEDILSDIEQQERGTLKLGAGSQRGAWILSHLLPDFHRRYPLVQVRFSDGLSTHLETLVSNGELDFAVVLSGLVQPGPAGAAAVPGAGLSLCPGEPAAPALFPGRGPGHQAALPPGGLDPGLCPAALRPDGQPAGPADAGALCPGTGTPRRPLYRDRHQPYSPPVRPGAGRLLLHPGGHRVQRLDPGGSAQHFPSYGPGGAIVQTLSLLRHRQRYLTHYAKYFMELLFQVAGEMERAQVSRVIPECPG